MGIRYDKDLRRTTNGPLIFFSDPSSEGAFAEEIRIAINAGFSFYGYRAPHSQMVTFGSSEVIVEGIECPGFVIGWFDSSKPFITIPYHSYHNSILSTNHSYTPPSVSTTYQEYSIEVENIIQTLSAAGQGKIVMARVIVGKKYLDIAEIFYKLSRKFPESFIFCFSTPITGCWIGASPELLLEGQNGFFNSMALAGTRAIGSHSTWDTKNIEEQQIVTEFIMETFLANGLNPILEETINKPTGSIEHICTPIFAENKDFNKCRLEKLLKSLSPTPALCGYPKDFALQQIKEHELFDRGCYGGFCGPFHSVNEFTFNVTLRCAYITQSNYCIYSGGGVTRFSSVKDEWEETSLKAYNTFDFLIE